MIDAIGQEIMVGDIVAHGTQSGSGNGILVRVVKDLRLGLDDFGEDTLEQVKVHGYEAEEMVLLPRGAWTTPDRLVVVTDQVTEELTNFLRGVF